MAVEAVVGYYTHLVNVSREGNGAISATTNVDGNDNDFKTFVRASVVNDNTVRIEVDDTWVNQAGSSGHTFYNGVVRISVAATDDYLSEYVDVQVNH